MPKLMERRAWSKKMLRMFGIVDLKVMLRIVERERGSKQLLYIYICGSFKQNHMFWMKGIRLHMSATFLCHRVCNMCATLSRSAEHCHCIALCRGQAPHVVFFLMSLTCCPVDTLKADTTHVINVKIASDVGLDLALRAILQSRSWMMDGCYDGFTWRVSERSTKLRHIANYKLPTKVRQAFSPAFHSFVNVDLPGGWLLVEAERAAEKGGECCCYLRQRNLALRQSTCLVGQGHGRTRQTSPRSKSGRLKEIIDNWTEAFKAGSDSYISTMYYYITKASG